MKNILIVTDTTSGFTIEKAEKSEVYLLPLSVIVEKEEYKDLYEMSAPALYEHDRQRKNLTTSQPNLGYLLNTMGEWKEKNYEHIIVITLATTLSGTYQAIKMTAEELDITNITIIDSLLVGSPMMEASIQAVAMVKEGKSVAEIVENCQHIFSNTTTFALPETLDNLKRGGRITGAAAAMSNLLKIKPLLYLENQNGTVEKHSVHRTESSVFKTIIKEYLDKGIKKETHKFYLLHADAEEILQRFVLVMNHDFPGIEYEIINLPAVLTTHTGVGTFGIQSVLKRQ